MNLNLNESSACCTKLIKKIHQITDWLPQIEYGINVLEIIQARLYYLRYGIKIKTLYTRMHIVQYNITVTHTTNQSIK